jgi:hypothetical protein
MSTDKQLEANRRNALHSSGPRTEQGVLACKNNALRHGLRALQTVVPGEDPDEWEAHRDAVVSDLAPAGALETALAEQVAAKHWRLGRVVRHEADLIANSQSKDELLRAHETTHRRLGSYSGPSRSDVPTRKDVENVKNEVEKAAEKLADQDECLRQIGALSTMADGDAFPTGWNPLYTAIEKALGFTERELARLFEGDDVDGPFLALHARKMLAKRGDPEQGRASVVWSWTKNRQDLENTMRRLRGEYKALARRYKDALERRRRSQGLPGPRDLDRIQRYEAHLERGLHRALDRLRDLQEARGAVPPRGPSVALAVVQVGAEKARESQMGPFGSFAPGTTGAVPDRSEG